jgi:hypothetical protein
MEYQGEEGEYDGEDRIFYGEDGLFHGKEWPGEEGSYLNQNQTAKDMTKSPIGNYQIVTQSDLFSQQFKGRLTMSNYNHQLMSAKSRKRD